VPGGLNLENLREHMTYGEYATMVLLLRFRWDGEFTEHEILVKCVQNLQSKEALMIWDECMGWVRDNTSPIGKKAMGVLHRSGRLDFAHSDLRL
jgi:hypothetical protein